MPRQSSEPQRTCIGCRVRTDRSQLLRVVVGEIGADGSVAVEPDVAAALPGRGAWVHHHLACFDLALRRRAFARALRTGSSLGLDAVRQHLQDTTSHQPTTEAEAGQHQMGTR